MAFLCKRFQIKNYWGWSPLTSSSSNLIYDCGVNTSETKTESKTRKLDLDACYNARDLGGYETSQGARTRWGAFVRADSLYRLTPKGRANLHAHGVRTVIDLRLPEELAREPNPFHGTSELNFVHLSLINPTHFPVLEDAIANQGMLAWNLKMLALSRNEITHAMQTIAHAPEGGVLFHCYAGKDRTGLISMFLLALAGVPQHTIAEDYNESNIHLQPMNEEFVAKFDDPDTKQRVWKNLMSGTENMLKIQTNLAEQYGGAELYLREGGLSSDDINAIRARLA